MEASKKRPNVSNHKSEYSQNRQSLNTSMDVNTVMLQV